MITLNYDKRDILIGGTQHGGMNFLIRTIYFVHGFPILYFNLLFYIIYKGHHWQFLCCIFIDPIMKDNHTKKQ